MRGMSGFFAIIPAHVLDDQALNAAQKILYAEISALCNREGYCWARNTYFSTKIGVTVRTVSRWLNELEDNGHIKRATHGNIRRIYLSDEALSRHTTEAYDRAVSHADAFEPHEDEDGKCPSGPAEKTDNGGEMDRNVHQRWTEMSYLNNTGNNTEDSKQIPTAKTAQSPSRASPSASGDAVGGKTATQKRERIAKEVGKLVLKRMTAQRPLTKEEYPQHAKRARAIGLRIAEMAPDTWELATQAVIQTYQDLTQTGSGFWRAQSFTPAALSSAGIWSRVIDEIQRRHQRYSRTEQPETETEWSSVLEGLW